MHRLRATHFVSLVATSQLRAQSQSQPPPVPGQGWRQQVTERDDAATQGGNFSDKTIASSAILSDKAYDESKKSVGGTIGSGRSATSSTKVSKTAQQTEAAMREDVEAEDFSPVDYYRRRLAYLALVRSRKGWVPLAAYGGIVYAMSSMGILAMPQALTAAAAVAILNKFVVAGTRSKWLKKANAEAATSNKSGKATSSIVESLPLYRQVAVITGATGALGREIAEQLQALGATVIVTHLPGTQPHFGATTTTSSSRPVAANPSSIITQASPPANSIPMRSYPLDLADRVSVRTFCGQLASDNANQAAAVPKIDMLVLSAGIHEPRFVPTKHNTDRHIEVNFLGQFLLTENLLPLVRRSQYSGIGESKAEKDSNTTAPPPKQTSMLRGGRIVYVSCTNHSLVGQKTNHKSIATAYSEDEVSSQSGPASAPSGALPSASTYKTKWLSEGDESYIHNVMYAVSKLGNIYHTKSLHERRYNGIDGGSPLAGNNNTNSGSNSSKEAPAGAKALRPYAAACAILPSFQSHLSRKLESDVMPTIVAESRVSVGLNADGSLPEEQSKQPKKSSVSIPLVGSASASVSDEAAIQSFSASALVGGMWRQTPSRAAETVLDVCLRPDIISGGFYHENREMSQARSNPSGSLFPFAFARVFEVLSASANNARMRNSLVGWAAQQTRSFTVDVSPYASKGSGRR